MKVCTKCGELKGEGEFHKHAKASDGLKSACKPCRKIETDARSHIKAATDRARKDRIKNGQPGRPALRPLPDSIVCGQCGIDKPVVDNFYLSKNHMGVDRLAVGRVCKACNRLNGNEWVKNNPERAKTRARRWRAGHHVQVLMTGARSRAKADGLKFDIVLSDIGRPLRVPTPGDSPQEIRWL